MRERCQDLKALKQALKDETLRQDTALEASLRSMQHAPESSKLAEMAALITMLAEQRLALDAQGARYEATMTEHLMQHMKVGKGPMLRCPDQAGTSA